MDDPAPFLTDTHEASERSLADDLRQLADDARALAQAEMAYQKSRAAFAGQETRGIAVLGLLAAVLAFFALMALVVGLIVALAPLLTAWGATAVCFGGLLLLAGLCAGMARSRWKRMVALLSDQGAT